MRERNILPVLFFTLLLDMVGIGMIIPIIPILFTDPASSSFLLTGYTTEAQLFIAGLLTALFGIMQFLTSPILGELSDIFGRKKILTIGVGILALSQFIFAVGISYGSLAILFISRAVAGVAGANFSVAQAMIADVTPPEKRAQNFGMIGAAFGIGFILGPLLGGLIASTSGNAALPFITAGILGVFNVLMVTFLLKETHTTRGAMRRISFFKAFHNIASAFSERHTRPLYATSFLVIFGFSFYTSYISIFLVDVFNVTEKIVGVYFAVAGIWIVFSQAVVVRILSKRYPDIVRLYGALPVLSIIFFTIPFVSRISTLYFLMPFLAASFALISTSTSALVSKNAGNERQGAALGINSSLQALAQASAPLIAGFAAGSIGLATPFLIGGFSVFCAFCIVVFYLRA